MCYRPLHISRYSNGRYAYDVPCGHCKECRERRVNELTFRVWYEFNYLNNEYNKEHPGTQNSRAIFCTLTYNQKHLPSVTVNRFFSPVFDDTGELLNSPHKPFTLSCWDKNSIQSFFKSMNDNLIYHIGTDILGLTRIRKRKITPEWKEFLQNYNIRPIKYLVTCERGKQNTKRPHYHAIILLNDSRLSITYVKNYIREHWNKGFSYNLTCGGNRDDFNCIKYVCKYVLKDYQETLFDRNLIFENEEIAYNSKPFTLQSNFLGASFLHEVSDHNIKFLCEHGVMLPGKFPLPIPLPRYYKKKFVSAERELVHPFITGSGEDRKLPPLVPVSRFFNKDYMTDMSSYLVFNKKHQVFSNDVQTGTQSFVFDDFENFEDYISKPRYYQPLNKYGKMLQENSRKVFADNICKLFDSVKTTPDTFYLYSGIPDCIDINTISRYSLHYFVEKGLYRHFDNLTNLVKNDMYPNTQKLYLTYLALRDFNNYMNFRNDTKHDLDYSRNLSDVMSNKPELFNNYDL